MVKDNLLCNGIPFLSRLYLTLLFSASRLIQIRSKSCGLILLLYVMKNTVSKTFFSL